MIDACAVEAKKCPEEILANSPRCWHKRPAPAVGFAVRAGAIDACCRPQRRRTRAISALRILNAFQECAQNPRALIVKSGDFPADAEEGDGLKTAASAIVKC
jgi:hypothetical protein